METGQHTAWMLALVLACSAVNLAVTGQWWWALALGVASGFCALAGLCMLVAVLLHPGPRGRE